MSQKRRHRLRTIEELVEVLERDGWGAITPAERARFMEEMSEGGRYLFTGTAAELQRLHGPDAPDEEKRRIIDTIRERKRIEDWEKLKALEARRGRHEEMRTAWLAYRQQGLGILAADRRVALDFDITADAVRRKRREQQWG